MDVKDTAAPPVRLIIAGGREFKNLDLLESSMKTFCDTHYVTKDQLTIVCGMAKGADLLGLHWAFASSIEIDRHPAWWRGEDGKGPYNKAAGYQRNERMAKVATHLLAFWDGESRGTKHMINLAEKYGLIVKVVSY